MVGDHMLISDNNSIWDLSGHVIGQVIYLAHHLIYSNILTQRRDYNFIALHSGTQCAFLLKPWSHITTPASMQLHFTKRLMEVHAESRLGPTGWVLLLSHILELCLLVFLSYWLWGTALELSVFNTLGQKSWFQFLSVPSITESSEPVISSTCSFCCLHNEDKDAAFKLTLQECPED